MQVLILRNSYAYISDNLSAFYGCLKENLFIKKIFFNLPWMSSFFLLHESWLYMWQPTCYFWLSVTNTGFHLQPYKCWNVTLMCIERNVSKLLKCRVQIADVRQNELWVQTLDVSTVITKVCVTIWNFILGFFSPQYQRSSKILTQVSDNHILERVVKMVAAATTSATWKFTSQVPIKLLGGEKASEIKHLHQGHNIMNQGGIEPSWITSSTS